MGTASRGTRCSRPNPPSFGISKFAVEGAALARREKINRSKIIVLLYQYKANAFGGNRSMILGAQTAFRVDRAVVPRALKGTKSDSKGGGNKGCQ